MISTNTITALNYFGWMIRSTDPLTISNANTKSTSGDAAIIIADALLKKYSAIANQQQLARILTEKRDLAMVNLQECEKELSQHCKDAGIPFTSSLCKHPDFAGYANSTDEIIDAINKSYREAAIELKALKAGTQTHKTL